MKDRTTKSRDRARRLRQTQTREEAYLWAILRNRKLFGHKFRRQVPIVDFIVDFACLEARLVIEVDGGIHQHPEVAARDQLREEHLAVAGYSILRLTNEQVLGQPAVLFATIKAHLSPLADLPFPVPTPYPKPHERQSNPHQDHHSRACAV
jgi:very-short-patch-repair endonuclease